jgi:hypothetical protein
MVKGNAHTLKIRTVSLAPKKKNCEFLRTLISYQTNERTKFSLNFTFLEEKFLLRIRKVHVACLTK